MNCMSCLLPIRSKKQENKDIKIRLILKPGSFYVGGDVIVKIND